MSDTDQRLLREYAEHRSEVAFAELVRRHVDLVYSAALRMVGDSHLAEDVAQRVFVALARQAGTLRNQAVLAGWLHRTARNIAAETVRTEVRRRGREQEAAAMNDLLTARPDALWEDVARHLDTLLGELPEPDRDAVLLRYFQRQSAREMAQTLGVSEDAAQRRVSRAVERLRVLFARRGLGIGAASLALIISANAVKAAPAGLAAAITAAASTTAAGAGAAAGVLKVIAMTKLQTAVVGALVASVLVAPLVMHQQTKLNRENLALRQQLAQLKADNEGLADKLKNASPSPAVRTVAATNLAAALPPFQQVTQFLMAHFELPRDQIEAYLQQNHRTTESLLAAFSVSHDLAYLREAATNSPNDPAVQCAVIANKAFPDDPRKWIDDFKMSSHENALPWYLAAQDDFKRGHPEQAIQELTVGAQRQYYNDFGAQSCQAIEEMYVSAGWPALAAKASAPGTSVAACGSVDTTLKDLASQVLQTQQQDFAQGDTAAGNTMASLGMTLGDQLRHAGAPIDQLVGIAIEKKLLAQLDPSGTYDFLGRPVSEVQADLDQQKAAIRQALQVRDQLRPTLSEAELGNYWDREKMYGEMYAMQWLQSRQRQP